jgi:hypothetical protein
MLDVLRTAPEDDGPTTAEEDAEAQDGWEAYLRGEAVSAEQAKRDLLD